MDQELERTAVLEGVKNDSIKELASIQTLKSGIESGAAFPKLSEPIAVVKFEMLEAELLNQRILPKTHETLSQKIRHEVNLLSWHAKRLGVDIQSINFLVDVPRLILKLSSQDMSPSTSSLAYLELFSDYIQGKFDSTSNKYEEGLNLVLNAILNSKQDKVLDQNTCILPISKTDFFKQLNLNIKQV